MRRGTSLPLDWHQPPLPTATKSRQIRIASQGQHIQKHVENEEYASRWQASDPFEQSPTSMTTLAMPARPRGEHLCPNPWLPKAHLRAHGEHIMKVGHDKVGVVKANGDATSDVLGQHDEHEDACQAGIKGECDS